MEVHARQLHEFGRSVLMNSLLATLAISFVFIMGCALSNPAAPASPASNEWYRMLGWPKPVTTGVVRGPLNGGGHVFMARRENGQWIVRHASSWVS